MTRYSNPIVVSPWTGRLHLALTLILVVAAAGIAGLAGTGRVQFGPKPVAADDSKSKNEEGRYQIEKVDAARKVLDVAGKTPYFQTPLLESWVFEYKGGLLETKIETDFQGEPESPGVVPLDWKSLLRRDESQVREPWAPVDRTGYIILSEIRSPPLADELAPYYAHLGGFLAFGSLGPLHVMPSLLLDVQQSLQYRVLVSTNRNADAPDGEFTVSALQSIRFRSPIIPKDPATEKVQVGGGKDLEPGKDELLLDRQRGHSRIRLKARFLGDEEARDLLPK